MPRPKLELNIHESYPRETITGKFRAPHDMSRPDAVYIDPELSPNEIFSDMEPQQCYDALSRQYGVPATQEGAKEAIRMYLTENPNPNLPYRDLNSLSAHFIWKAAGLDEDGTAPDAVTGNDKGATYAIRRPTDDPGKTGYKICVGSWNRDDLKARGISPDENADGEAVLMAILRPLKALRAAAQSTDGENIANPEADRERFALLTAFSIIKDDDSLPARYGFDFTAEMLTYANRRVNARSCFGRTEPFSDLNAIYAFLDSVATAGKTGQAPIRSNQDTKERPIPITGDRINKSDGMPAFRNGTIRIDPAWTSNLQDKSVTNGDIPYLTIYAISEAIAGSPLRDTVSSISVSETGPDGILSVDEYGTPKETREFRINMRMPDAPGNPAETGFILDALVNAFARLRTLEYAMLVTGDIPVQSEEDIELAVSMAVRLCNPRAYELESDINQARLSAMLSGLVMTDRFCRSHPEIFGEYDEDGLGLAGMAQSVRTEMDAARESNLDRTGSIPPGYDPAEETYQSPMADLYKANGINVIATMPRLQFESSVIRNAVSRNEAGKASGLEAWLVRNSPVFTRNMDLKLLERTRQTDTVPVGNMPPQRRHAVADRMRRGIRTPS